MAKESKLAARAKKVQRRPGCPSCQAPMIDANYFPTEGGSYDVLLCGPCQLVVMRDGEVVKLP